MTILYSVQDVPEVEPNGLIVPSPPPRRGQVSARGKATIRDTRDGRNPPVRTGKGRYEACTVCGLGERVPLVVPNAEVEGVVVGDIPRNVGENVT